MVEAKSVKHCLEGWREAVLHADALFGWKEDWYPAVIAAVLTLKFLLVWYWDPTLLTFLAVTGAVLTLADYLGPKIMKQVFKPEAWTGEKEARFDRVCEHIVSGLDSLSAFRRFCGECKEKKPIVHFVATVGALFCLAWIGGTVNNFFLLYVATVGVAMLPGLHRRGMLKKAFAGVTLKVNEMIRGGGGAEGHKKAE